MEEQFNTAELNEMKEQISLLRRKLEKETIVNEKLIRTSMRDKLKAVKLRSYILCVIVLISCPVWTTPIFNFHSPWFIGVTIAFLLIAVVYEIYCNQLLSTQNYITGSLVDEARKLNRYKQLSRQWHWFSIPFLCIWLPWFVYEATSMGGFFVKNILCYPFSPPMVKLPISFLLNDTNKRMVGISIKTADAILIGNTARSF